MNRVNHQHLYYFWTVAKEGSVAKACKQLCLAQPTVSGQVIQLEKDLGKPLFERRRKKLLLTKEGRLVLAYAEKIFGHTRAMLEALESNAEPRRLIRIGADEDVSKQAALQLIRFVSDQSGGLEVQINEGRIADLMDQLQRFALDLVLSSQPGPVHEGIELVQSEVAHMAIYFVAAPAIARRIRSFPKDLSNIPLLIPSRSSSLWEGVQHFLTRHEVEAPVVIAMEDAGLMRQAALDGMGAAPLTGVAVQEDLAHGRLMRLSREPLGVSRTLWLTARRGYNPDSLVGEAMRDFRISV